MDNNETVEKVQKAKEFWTKLFTFYQNFISGELQSHSYALYRLISDQNEDIKGKNIK